MSEGNLLTGPSKTKPPVSILKTKPTNASRLACEYNFSAYSVKLQNLREFFILGEGRPIECL